MGYCAMELGDRTRTRTATPHASRCASVGHVPRQPRAAHYSWGKDPLVDVIYMSDSDSGAAGAGPGGAKVPTLDLTREWGEQTRPLRQVLRHPAAVRQVLLHCKWFVIADDDTTFSLPRACSGCCDHTTPTSLYCLGRRYGFGFDHALPAAGRGGTGRAQARLRRHDGWRRGLHAAAAEAAAADAPRHCPQPDTPDDMAFGNWVNRQMGLLDARPLPPGRALPVPRCRAEPLAVPACGRGGHRSTSCRSTSSF